MISYHETGIGATLRLALVIALTIIGGAASIATVAAFFGDVWWGFDLAANYRWHLMWIALIAAILYALTAKGIATVVFLGAAVLNGWLIAPLWTGSQPAATGEDGVTIVHVDLSGDVADYEAALRWLFDSNGDLILIAGVTEKRAQPLVANGSPYTMLAAPESADSSGIVILGKDSWKVDTTMTEDGQPVYQVSVPSGNGLIDIVTAWGDMATSGEAADALKLRLEAVGEAVNTATNPVAVVGNLGATRWSKGMRTLESTTDLRDASEGFGYLATSPVSTLPVIGGWVGLPIDVVFMEPTVTPLELDTGPDIGADHLPLTVIVGPAYES